MIIDEMVEILALSSRAKAGQTLLGKRPSVL
jgi:hypothetical protein